MSNAIPVSFGRLGERRRDLEARRRRHRAWVLTRVVCIALIGMLVARQFPRFTFFVVGAALVIAFCWLWWIGFRRNQSDNDGERYLAGTSCPSCSQVFGSEVAHLARTGEFLRRALKKEGMEGDFVDMFGFWAIDCAHCAAEILYDPDSHEFIVQRSAASDR